MQIYFIRHAQSENNALWDQTGSSDGRNSDPELTLIGRQQAELLAKYLSHEPSHQEQVRWDPQNRAGFELSHLYTSLMVRAVATAAPLARALKLPLHAWPDLHETGGIYLDSENGEKIGLPGKDCRYFRENYPELLFDDDFIGGGWWNRPFEPDEAIQARARTVLNELRKNHGDSSDRVGLISHGAFTNALLGELLGFSVTSSLWLILNNTAITRVDLYDDHTELVYHNRADHLPDHLVT